MKKSILLLLCLQTSLSIFAQYDAQIMHHLRVDVVYLASDYLAGRETGTMGEDRAADYIAMRYKELGLSPKGNQEWLQPFDFSFNPNPHEAKGEPRTGKNVIGYLDNKAKHTIVIGAHYDHLGHGEFGSRHTGEADIHNGADDNASGVAVMLRLAEYLAAGNAKKNNYLFIAFSGEEMGLYGSKHFVNQPTINLEKVNYMLNLDMVGRLNTQKVLAINGSGTSPVWEESFAAMDVNGITVKTSKSGIGPSDHTSFYLKNIPALHFFSGQHTDYHKPEDDSELVNFEGMYDISDYLIALIEQLDGSKKIAFTKTKDDNQGRKAAAFKVTLGIMPDYVYNGSGMRIDAVIDGRVAAKAGIENGDVVIKMGDRAVKDIYDYMEGLADFKAGDKTIVVVERKGKKIEKVVEF